MGYCFHFNCFFRFLKSLRKITRFDLGLGCEKYGAPYSESFDTSRTPNRNKIPTSFLKFVYTLDTGYGRKNISFASYFNSKSNGSVFHIKSVP